MSQATLGNRNVIIPYLGNEYRTLDGYKKAAASMNKIAADCQKRGMELAYHNHSFEFQTFEGKKGYDILWDNTEPHLVKAEVDVYWVKHGGEDPGVAHGPEPAVGGQRRHHQLHRTVVRSPLAGQELVQRDDGPGYRQAGQGLQQARVEPGPRC